MQGSCTTQSKFIFDKVFYIVYEMRYIEAFQQWVSRKFFRNMTEGEARRFLTAPLPEGVADKDTEDFAAFEIGHACGKARRLAHDRPCAGTFKTVAGGRNIYPFRHRRRFSEGSGIRFGGGSGSRPGAAGKRLERF